MNKYQKSLNWIHNNLVWTEHGCEMSNPRIESIEILQELVDRATPKKPSIALSINGEAESYCRSCQRRFSTPVSWARISYIHCPECGQKLDWSEE